MKCSTMPDQKSCLQFIFTFYVCVLIQVMLEYKPAEEEKENIPNNTAAETVALTNNKAAEPIVLTKPPLIVAHGGKSSVSLAVSDSGYSRYPPPPIPPLSRLAKKWRQYKMAVKGVSGVIGGGSESTEGQYWGGGGRSTEGCIGGGGGQY